MQKRKDLVQNSCVFCDIAEEKISATYLLKTKNIVVFKTIEPKAPIHYLIVPKKHIASLGDASSGDSPILGEILLVAKEAAFNLGLKNGYKIVINVGKMGGQSVFHLHVHLIGGWSSKEKETIERIA